jgi:tRNA pseudouridine55 synthase
MCALARDLGRILGCFGHVTALRRTRVDLSLRKTLHTLDEIETQNMAAEALPSVEAGLAELPCVVVDRDTAARLRRGGSVICAAATRRMRALSTPLAAAPSRLR